MQLRANHLTVSRILLLPFPCALLFGGRVEMLIALVVFSVLAATDWYDGQLARKHGPTVLGGLLDPVADKMFLAFTFLPIARIELFPSVPILPLWLVLIIFARDLGVTALRSLTAFHKVEFKTSILAKFKTAIQMAGGGFLVWDVIWFDEPWILVAGNAVGVAVILSITGYRLIRRRPVGLMLWVQVFGFVGALIVALVLPVRWCVLSIGAVIVGVTVISWGQYAVRVGRGMSKAGWPLTFGQGSLGLAETISPIAVVSLFAVPEVPAWAPIAVLAAELGSGGLDNLLATERIKRRQWLAWLRCLAFLALAGVGWAGELGYHQVNLAPLSTMVAAAIACIYTIGLFLTHRKQYLR